MKDQTWVRCLKLIQHDPTLLGMKDYCFFTRVRNIKLPTAEVSGGTWKNLSIKASSKSTYSNRGSLRRRTVEHFASYPTAAHNHSVQDNWMSPYLQWRQGSAFSSNTPLISIHVFFPKLSNKIKFLLLTVSAHPSNQVGVSRAYPNLGLKQTPNCWDQGHPAKTK